MEREQTMDDRHIKLKDAIEVVREAVADEYIESTLELRLLDKSLTADVRENVRGEWVEEYDDDAAIFFKRRWVCSACGDYQTYGKPKFCPNCGADMRGDDNGKSNEQ